MFVALERESSHWRQISSTTGVSRLVNFGGQLGGLLLDLVSGLMLRRDASGKIWPPNQLSAGNKVQVLNGPFASFLETVGNADAKHGIWVLIDFMERGSRPKVQPE